MSDEFEIVPEKEISNLKKEIKQIKENPFGDNETGSRFFKTIDNLNESMNNMLNLFKIAADSLQVEEKEEVFVAEKIKPLFEKVDKVIEQNEKLAKALVSVADMIEELRKSQETLTKVVKERLNNPLSQERYFDNQNQFGQTAGSPGSLRNSVGQVMQGQSSMQPSGVGSQNLNLNQSPNLNNDIGFKGNSLNGFPGGQNTVNSNQGFPSPFLDDNSNSLNSGLGSNNFGNNVSSQKNNQTGSQQPNISGANNELPSFSEFNKMSMPPPPKETKKKKGGLFGFKK